MHGLLGRHVLSDGGRNPAVSVFALSYEHLFDCGGCKHVVGMRELSFEFKCAELEHGRLGLYL